MLIIYGCELGRTPVVANANGSVHNHRGFMLWLADVRTKYRSTVGFVIVPVDWNLHVHNLNAFILYLMGLHH